MAAKNTNPAYRVVDGAIAIALRLVPPSAWAEKIALWWGYRFQPSPGSARLRSGYRINLTANDHLQLLLRYLGTFEPYCLKELHRAPKGGTILDVGANIGLFTIEAAAVVGPTGHVISIEASPQHVISVRQSVALNGLKNVTVIQCAAGDAPGQAVLTLPVGANLGMFTVGHVEGTKKFSVNVRTIDDILAENGVDQIDFIKMDIEGSEYRALKGAENVISRWHPTILIELNEKALVACGTSARSVKKLLFDHGYKGYLVGSNNPITIDQTHDCDECLFMH